MPLLDTDALTIIQRRAEPQYTRLLRRFDALAGETVWVSVVSFEEQLRGWLKYVKDAKPHQLVGAYAKLQALNADFSTRPVLPFSERAAEVLARLVKARTRVATTDLRIAAIAIANDLTLVSMNLKHFRQVPGLRAEDWTA